MGYLFDEKKFISENVLLQDQRITSQYSRFLDSTPTYVTYYNISNIESTADYGFKNIEKLLGDTSPLRFNKVTNLPIYGIENIIPRLEDEEQGLDINFDGEGVILPNTVRPRPNDLFIIDYMGKSIIFMVTTFEYDSMRNNGYYNIGFTLKWVNPEKFKQLERQTVDSFECYVENIGTEEKVLIRSQDVETLNKLNKVTTDISNYYMMLFYDKKYNSFLLNQPNGTRLYDRLLTHFINKNKIFFNRSQYETIRLSQEDPNRLLAVEYHNSIFRAIEEKDPTLVRPMYYGEGYLNDISSIFFHWRDGSIRSTFFNIGNIPYVRPEILEVFKDAKEFFRYEEPHEKVEDRGIVNVSIPVNEGDVYTIDAGYGSKLTDTKTEEEIVEEVTEDKPKTRISIDDLTEVISESERASEDVEVYVKPQSSITPEYTTDSNGTYKVDVKNIKDIVIEHGYKLPEGEDIMTKTITMYLSGNAPSLTALELDELLKYVEYMHPNHETFVLVPVLLYVLERYYKGYLEDNY